MTFYDGLKTEASFWIAAAMADEGWLNTRGVPLLMACMSSLGS
jgi:hypothetical protein